MTLEEIKASIKRTIDQAYERDDRNVAIVLNNVITMLDQLEPSWHPYPAEKPTEKNGYVVSVVDESNGYCFTDASFYHPNLDRFEIDDVYQLHVYAWAERPKPYKKDGTT